jgi:hypothetical protein
MHNTGIFVFLCHRKFEEEKVFLEPILRQDILY